MKLGSTQHLTPTDKHWIIDIEADDLNATRVWVVVVKNAITDEEHVLVDVAAIREFFERNSACYFVGHNIIKFDAPTLNRVVGTHLRNSQLVDTLLLSMLYSPNLSSGHSLAAWANRMGLKKGTFNDWSKLSDEMVAYCRQDVLITRQLYIRLTERMRKLGFTELGADIEHRAWVIANKQQKNGFAFAEKEAQILLAELTGVLDNLTGRIREVFPAEEQRGKTFAKSHKADGTPTAYYLKHVAQYPRVELNADGSYTVYQLVEFNIGSPKQRVEKLVELGWEPGPTEQTSKGTPTPTRKGELVPSLADFSEKSGIDEIRLIAQWIAINARINAVKDWLSKLGPDGCIHGSLWLAGSLRYRHDKPNTANIPAVKVKEEKQPDGTRTKTILRGLDGFFTYEARDLWRTREPKKRNLVGVDAAGIQLRVLAHYLGDKDYIETILHGRSEDGTDIHSRNQAITGIGTRDQTKTFTYAVLLGAGANKVGEICGVTSREGAGIKKRFIEGVPGLKELYARLETEFDRTGRISLCDGSVVLVPDRHMVLAYLLQGDESRIMKVAGILTDEQVRKHRLDALKVGDIHDEWQNDVIIEHTEPFSAFCHSSFKEAGEFFNYNLPIECNVKVGKTWAETH